LTAPQRVEHSVSEDLFIPSSFDGTARLFPLPNVVLFPHVMLPLHIFEPRYRQMTADSLATDRLIAMVLLKSGWEEQYESTPAIHDIGCLAKILTDQKLEDGRYNMLVRGLSRARIAEELQTDRLYRIARVELLSDIDLAGPDSSSKLRRRLARLARKWFSDMGGDFQQFETLFTEELPLGTIGDLLSFVLPLSQEFKQKLLGQTNVERRIGWLLKYLEEKTPLPTSSPAKFPPEFSSN
jgi:Lon protease-like protein